MEKIYYSYDNIHNLIFKNKQKVIDYKPELIIAIGGGGLIPARILRTFYNIPIYVVTLSLYDNDKIKDTIKIVQWIDEKINLNNKKILIVDEVDDTRKTLEFCIRSLKLINKANKIGVFVLQNKVKQKAVELDEKENINYISCEDIEDKWVVYPWDINN